MDPSSGGSAPATATQVETVPLPGTGIWDWAGSIPFIAAFFLLLVVFDLLQRLAYLFSRRLHLKVVTALNWSLTRALGVTGATVQVHGSLELPQDLPIVVISNHQSLFDIPVLHTVFASHFPRFVAKIELAKWIPSVSFNLRKGGNAIVDRKNPRQAVTALKKFGERLAAEKFAAVIFPEGTRARDGKLKKFRTAGFTTLLQGVPGAIFVPVAIDGSWLLTVHKCLPVPRGLKMQVWVGQPLEVSGDTDPDELLEKAYAFVKERIETSRAVSAAGA